MPEKNKWKTQTSRLDGQKHTWPLVVEYRQIEEVEKKPHIIH